MISLKDKAYILFESRQIGKSLSPEIRPIGSHYGKRFSIKMHGFRSSGCCMFCAKQILQLNDLGREHVLNSKGKLFPFAVKVTFQPTSIPY